MTFPLTMESQTAATHESQATAVESPDHDEIGSVEKPQRHSHDYFEDGIFILKVEDVFFKVQKYLLARDSSVFEGMFACPPGSEGAQGSSEGTAIPLPGVKVEEMEALMEFYYGQRINPSETSLHRALAYGGRTLCSNRRCASEALRKDKDKFPLDPQVIMKLFFLLSISTRFDFDGIREKAIDSLQRTKFFNDMTSIELVEAARKYEVDTWLEKAYFDLCIRRETLSAKEIGDLGPATAAMMSAAREELCFLVGSECRGQRTSPWENDRRSSTEVIKAAHDTVKRIFFPAPVPPPEEVV